MGLDRSPEQLIKAGLAALKQKDYERAIATFQALTQVDKVSANYRLKAQMGLIRTYEAQGANAQAQELCQPLLKSHSQAIRQWAYDKLQQLISNSGSSGQHPIIPDNTAEAVSGFVPETSGFVPFNINESGIEPINSPGNSNSSIAPQSIENSSDDPSTSNQPSLFHYQTLNNRKNLEIAEVRDLNSLENNNHHPTAAHHQGPNSSEPTTLLPSENSDQITPAPQLNTLIKRSHRLIPATSTPGPETWPQGERLSTLKSLGRVGKGRLWFAQLTTIPICFFVIRWLAKITLTFIGNYLNFLRDFSPIHIRVSYFFWEPQYWTVLISLGVLTITSPWLWSWLLQPTNQINRSQLQIYSPEAAQLLHRLCAKRHWQFPKIQLIADELPLIFSYGWRPRYGQLVLSQGLLDQLDPDELAAIIMYEISHWSTLDWIFFSSHGLILQVCHRAYWFLARWGKDRPIILQLGAGTLATLSYGIFWLLSKVGCSLARTRTPYRDRIATELTGNPNGLIRALAKLSAAMANAIEQQGYTPALLESLDAMLPVGPQRAGASAKYYAWGAFNPLRHWLSVNQAHPPLGDRLYILNAYGRYWRLKPSLNFAHLSLRNSSQPLSTNDWQNLLLQGGVWSGLILGLGLGMGMWLIGAIATSLKFPLLAWLYQDRSILIGIPLICAATSQLLRINSFFPEITDIPTTSPTQFSVWQTDHTLLPLSYRPLKINGTLTGRPALANWLGQEWRLQTDQGNIKLHHAAFFGPLSNIRGLTPLLHKPLQVTGWLRGGHYLWIDIEYLQDSQGHTKLSHHPIWSVITSILPLGYGLWLILRGG